MVNSPGLQLLLEKKKEMSTRTSPRGPPEDRKLSQSTAKQSPPSSQSVVVDSLPSAVTPLHVALTDADLSTTTSTTTTTSPPPPSAATAAEASPTSPTSPPPEVAEATSLSPSASSATEPHMMINVDN